MKKVIGFYHPAFPGGGAERITLDIIRYLERSGQYEIYVITQILNERYVTDSMRSLNIVVLPDLKSTQEDIEKAMSDLFRRAMFTVFVQVGGPYFPWLRKLADAFDTRIVFANHSGPYWEEIEIVRSRSEISKKSIKDRIEWLLFRKFAYTVLGKARKKSVRIQERIYRDSDAYTVLCDEYKMIFRKKLGLGPGADKFVVMHNPEYEVPDISYAKKNVVLFVGRLTLQDKRPDRLLRIWKKVQDKIPDYTPKIVGDGPERENLIALSRKLGLHRTSFEGYRTDVASYYRDASVLCLTSSSEGWPLCLTEAQSNGVIPIAFGCSGGVREILGPSGENGFIVRPFSEREFARTLLDVLKMPEEEKMRIRHNAVRKSRTYSVDSICERWKKLFDSLSSDGVPDSSLK